MISVNKSFKNNAALYFVLQLLLFFVLMAAYFFSDELGLGQYLSVVISIGVILYLLLFYNYKRNAVHRDSNNGSGSKKKQPWE
jgi:energy-coupling factor transporter transmembrane protein EcfT